MKYAKKKLKKYQEVRTRTEIVIGTFVSFQHIQGIQDINVRVIQAQLYICTYLSCSAVLVRTGYTSLLLLALAEI